MDLILKYKVILFIKVAILTTEIFGQSRFKQFQSGQSSAAYTKLSNENMLDQRALSGVFCHLLTGVSTNSIIYPNIKRSVRIMDCLSFHTYRCPDIFDFIRCLSHRISTRSHSTRYIYLRYRWFFSVRDHYGALDINVLTRIRQNWTVRKKTQFSHDSWPPKFKSVWFWRKLTLILTYNFLLILAKSFSKTG